MNAKILTAEPDGCFATLPSSSYNRRTSPCPNRFRQLLYPQTRRFVTLLDFKISLVFNYLSLRDDKSSSAKYACQQAGDEMECGA